LMLACVLMKGVFKVILNFRKIIYFLLGYVSLNESS
jgi:hypothetical protein